MPKRYTYLRNLREELQGLESAHPDCLRHLLGIMDNVIAEVANLEDRLDAVQQSANVASCLANGIRPD